MRSHYFRKHLKLVNKLTLNNRISPCSYRVSCRLFGNWPTTFPALEEAMQKVPGPSPSEALASAYSSPKVDSLEKFMNKAYPAGPRNTAEYAVFGADKVLQYLKRNQLWSLTFGLACCAVEMMHTHGARYDFHRFNMIPRASPRQARVMIISGTLTNKMAPALRTVWGSNASSKICCFYGKLCKWWWKLPLFICCGSGRGSYCSG
eukprot:UN11451